MSELQETKTIEEKRPMKKDKAVYKEKRGIRYAKIIKRFGELAHIKTRYRKGLFEAFCEAIYDALCEGEKVPILGVGAFYLYDRPCRFMFDRRVGKWYITGRRTAVGFKFNNTFLERLENNLLEKFGWVTPPVYFDEKPSPAQIAQIVYTNNGYPAKDIERRVKAYEAKEKTKKFARPINYEAYTKVLKLYEQNKDKEAEAYALENFYKTNEDIGEDSLEDEKSDNIFLKGEN